MSAGLSLTRQKSFFAISYKNRILQIVPLMSLWNCQIIASRILSSFSNGITICIFTFFPRGDGKCEIKIEKFIGSPVTRRRWLSAKSKKRFQDCWLIKAHFGLTVPLTRSKMSRAFTVNAFFSKKSLRREVTQLIEVNTARKNGLSWQLSFLSFQFAVLHSTSTTTTTTNSLICFIIITLGNRVSKQWRWVGKWVRAPMCLRNNSIRQRVSHCSRSERKRFFLIKSPQIQLKA